MDIIIVADFFDSFDGTSNSRFSYLAELLSSEHCVEVITSDFNHGEKKHFNLTPDTYPYTIKMLHEPLYKKNVCLKRFYSHYIWGCNVKNYLKERKKPDVVYCAVPTLMAAYETAKYCEKNGIRFIIDVQDLWPEAFQMIFSIPILSKILFAPFNIIANGIYKRADEVCAVSDTYVKRALRVNKKCKNGHCVYLGTKLDDFDANVKNFVFEKEKYGLPDKNGLWMGYCGTLGSSYDLTSVFDALEAVREKGYEPPLFVVMGRGPRKVEFERYAREKHLPVFFTDILPYQEMCGLLCKCDMTINPISHGAAQSIINKHADYVASGLPVLNTQECEEYRNLIDDYNMGLNCNNNDSEDLAEKMICLIKSEALRARMGENSRKCAVEKFDRKHSYLELIDVIVGSKTD